jgi:flagellar assembly protein FliH
MSDSAVRTVRIVDAASPKSGFVPGDFARIDNVQSMKNAQTNGEWSASADRYELGFEDGRRAAQDTFEIERAALQRLMESVGALQPESSEELAMLIAETVYRLVADIVGKSQVDADCLSRRASAAAALIAECDNARTLCVNPEDVPLLEGLRTNLEIKGDSSLARGDVRIDCSAGWIEHGTSLYLDALRCELGLVDVAA